MTDEQAMKLEIFRAVLANGVSTPEIAADETNKVYIALNKKEEATDAAA